MKKRLFDSIGEMSEATAKLVAKVAKEAIKEQGKFSLVISGGRSPVRLFELLASEYLEKIEWGRTHIFWADERCVQPGNKESNYTLAYNLFISKLVIPETNIHRIPAELKPSVEAARFYEEKILEFFDGKEPSFDMIILGIGEDGHTASLFPGDEILFENERLVAAVKAPEYAVIENRITMTLPLINRSENVVFITSESEKKKVLDSIFNDNDKAQALYPAALVCPKGELYWHISKEVI